MIRAVTESGGMFGFSVYPHHLKDKSDCSLSEFCEMIARTADRYGAAHLGIGTDLCQDQPDSIVEWMRVGRWTKDIDYGEGSKSAPGVPAHAGMVPRQPRLRQHRDRLRATGMSDAEVAGIMGGNWYRFFAENFGPTQKPHPTQEQ